MKTKISNSTSSHEANTLLAAGAPNRKPKCYNCKFASSAFKIGNKTHHQCNHPKHKEGFENGTLSPWDTLQEFYNTCQSHEYRST
jgi:hypothetical protein